MATTKKTARKKITAKKQTNPLHPYGTVHSENTEVGTELLTRPKKYLVFAEDRNFLQYATILTFDKQPEWFAKIDSDGGLVFNGITDYDHFRDSTIEICKEFQDRYFFDGTDLSQGALVYELTLVEPS